MSTQEVSKSISTFHRMVTSVSACAILMSATSPALAQEKGPYALGIDNYADQHYEFYATDADTALHLGLAGISGVMTFHWLYAAMKERRAAKAIQAAELARVEALGQQLIAKQKDVDALIRYRHMIEDLAPFEKQFAVNPMAALQYEREMILADLRKAEKEALAANEFANRIKAAPGANSSIVSQSPRTTNVMVAPGRVHVFETVEGLIQSVERQRDSSFAQVRNITVQLQEVDEAIKAGVMPKSKLDPLTKARAEVQRLAGAELELQEINTELKQIADAKNIKVPAFTKIKNGAKFLGTLIVKGTVVFVFADSIVAVSIIYNLGKDPTLSPILSSNIADLIDVANGKWTNSPKQKTLLTPAVVESAAPAASR